VKLAVQAWVPAELAMALVRELPALELELVQEA
jgi:hypothetical protein